MHRLTHSLSHSLTDGQTQICLRHRSSTVEEIKRMVEANDAGKVAVSWLKIVGLRLGLGLGLAARILSHETTTLP